MHSKTAPRRRHSTELKTRILAECDVPGASVAAVAQAHGLNANLVHKWRRGRGTGVVSVGSGAAEPAWRAAFVPVSLASPRVAPRELPQAMAASEPTTGRDIRMELKRGALGVSIAWPICEASECAAWLRELLR